jgi:hypothetical protein
MPVSRKSIVTFLTLATLSSVSLSAMASGSICSDPLAKICKETVNERAERDKFVKGLKSEISIEAESNAAPRIAEMKKQISGIHFIKRFLAQTRIRNQEIMRSAKKRITGFESVVTNDGNVDKIKNYMYQAIDTSHFSENTKLQFKEAIKSIKVGNFADFLEKSDLENNVMAQMLGNACGSDGLIDNAFATTLKGERYVLICPGFLITLNQAASDADRFNSILQAISHEMGHHIDNSKVGNELYAPYLNCLSNNYSDRFNKSSDDQKFCKTNEKDPAKCNEQVVLSHSGELIADQWGIKVTAIHAKSESYSTGDAEQMLSLSWSKLCGSGDEGIHPTGDFRMGTLMRKNPAINDFLSCNASETDSKPACTFDGAQAIN